MSLLRLSSTNDAIEPAQQCIKPPAPVVTKDQTKTDRSSRPETQPLVEFEGDLEGRESVPRNHPELDQPVTINLGDCLACSGCVTSAETVLVTLQTQHQVEKILLEGTKRIFLSISPQSLIAIAAKYKCSPREASQSLSFVLKEKLGIDVVASTCLGQDISLHETACEFVRKFRKKEGDDKNACPLPLLTSSCPGWVCYVEKVQHPLLPLLSTTKSGQQITGTLVKNWLAPSLLRCPSSAIFHVSVMSCHDRKLEASRSDFFDELTGSQDVDCVITTSELLTLLKDHQIDLRSELVEDPKECSSSTEMNWWIHQGSGAGGYLEYTLRYAARELFGITISPDMHHPQLMIKRKNADLVEWTLLGVLGGEGGEVPLLRFASVYGFRNIQNIVRRLKTIPKRSLPTTDYEYDFIEVMACPGACLAGAGQPSGDGNDHLTNLEAPLNRKEMVNRSLNSMNLLYTHLPHLEPISQGTSDKAYREWLGGEASPLLHTQYHAVAFEDQRKSAFKVQW